MDKTTAVSFVMIIIFTIPTLSPIVTAEWESDGWIKNLIGPDRLSIGDEFGCHGFENKDINEDVSLIEECKDYVMSNTNASRWGINPISFGTPPGDVNQKLTSNLIDSGFKIIGDKVTNNPPDLFVVERNGGSMEKNVANISLIADSPKDSLVSIYWIARIHDLRIREDKTLLNWLENNESLWYTTWGEWHNHKLSSENIELSNVDNILYITLPNNPNNSWNVPGSIHIKTDNSIISVKDSKGNNFPQLVPTDQNLKIGWRNHSGGFIVTLNSGQNLSVVMQNSTNYTLQNNPIHTFNDLHHSVTVVGHHVTNMREWASDFLESPILFTWLIERGAEPNFNWPIIFIAIGTLIATPLAIRWLISMDAKEIIDYTG
jgi:hypothetical protein